MFAPNLTSPIGGESFNKGSIAITWEIKDPPVSDGSITLSDVTYEIEYTENDTGRDAEWHVVRRRIPGTTSNWTWNVGQMLKGDRIKLRIRSFCEKTNETSEYSKSPTPFSVNVYKLTPPSLLAPIPNKSYSDFITIILEEGQIVNTFNQKVRYTFEYQSENNDIDWTVLFEDLPVGSTPLRWNVDALPSGNDYQLKMTVSDKDTHQYSTVFVRDIRIVHPGLFYIDTQPPTGYIEFEGRDQITNELDQVLNVFVEDSVTEIKTMALRQKNLTSSEEGVSSSLLTLGKVTGQQFNPVQLESDCETFDQSGPMTGYVPKLNWRLTDQSGLIKVDMKLVDYGGNDSCIGKNHLFLPIWKSDETLTDMLLFTESKEVLALSNTTPQVESADYNVAYVSTLSGKIYKLDPYSKLLYNLGYKISKLFKYSDFIYAFAYKNSEDVAQILRDDGLTDLTLVTEFTDPMSEITAVAEYDGNLYFGMTNGQLWKFDGASFSELHTFTNAINVLHGDNRYLYIGFISGESMYLYNGSSFLSLDIEI